MNSIVENLRTDLIRNADEKTRKSGKRFFKEDVTLHGVRSAIVGKISKEHYQLLQDKSKENVFRICEELWQTGIMEEGFIACNWSYFVKKQYLPEDFIIFEKWVENYISNWAACDTLCNHTVGAIVEKYPECLSQLKKWAKSPNRWVKRASAVSLIIPARNGLFLNDIYACRA